MSAHPDLGLVPDEPESLGLIPDDPHALGLTQDSMSPKEMAIAGVKGAAKAFDYQRGAGLVAMDMLGQKLGKKAVMSPEQQTAALSPATSEMAPSYRDALKTWDAPEGPRPSDLAKEKYAPPLWKLASQVYAEPGTKHSPLRPERGGWLDPSARDVAGTGLDIAMDPATYTPAGLAGKLPVVGKGFQAMSRVPEMLAGSMKRAGEGLYDSGIRPIIQAGERYFNPEVAQTLRSRGVWGSPLSIERGIQNAAKDIGPRARDIEVAADQAGAVTSKTRAWQGLQDRIDEMVQSRRITQDEGDRIFADATEAQRPGPDASTVSEMRQWKTDANNALPGSTWDSLSTSKPQLAGKLQQELPQGYRAEVEAEILRTLGPSQLEKYQEAQRLLGNMINKPVQRAAERMASSYERTPLLSSQDLMLMAIGGGAGAAVGHTAGHTAEGGIGALATKKAIGAFTSTAAKTGMGLGMVRASEAVPTVAPMLKRMMIDRLRKGPYDTDGK